MKNLPIGIQAFEKAIHGNCLYVDKTKTIYLIATQGHWYFLSRPRRFGKSLLISTLEALFKNKRELFAGLWVDSSDYHWASYPVITIDFSGMQHTSEALLTQKLILAIKKNAKEYAIRIPQEFLNTPGSALDYLVTELARTQGPVVILVDEYDHPILGNLPNGSELGAIHKLLQSFYATIKSLDQYLHFVFITGVSKFAKTSIFSGMNNLEDLTFRPETAALLGYTSSELVTYFAPYLGLIATTQNTTQEQLLEKLTHWYDGYDFSGRAERVFNPFSILLFCKTKEFLAHWFETGTPTFLMRIIEEKKQLPQDFESLEIGDSDLFASYGPDQFDLVPLLVQTGYLTIKSYDAPAHIFTLSFPNQEVRIALSQNIAKYVSSLQTKDYNRVAYTLAQALLNNNLEEFAHAFQTFLARVPYTIHIPQERYYQTIFYVALVTMGIAVDVEVATNSGRIDAIITTPARIFIFEFKIDQPAAAALAQIKDKRYAQKYQLTSKPVTLVGMSFDTTARNITEWVCG